MVNAKFTPGPWKIDARPFNLHGAFHIASKREHGEGYIVATTMGMTYTSESEAQGNAHLIAAAPDLLEALEALYAIQTPESCPDFTAHKVLKAIAKARGK